MYSAIKHLHLLAVALSGSLFLLRGVWMLQESPRLAYRWVRIVPHVIDTVLLSAAIALMVLSGMYPFMQPWLTAKFFALLAYIGLGTFALKRGKTHAQRLVCWVLAVCVFFYMVLVALSKSPVPDFSRLMA
ncbi:MULTISPECIES: SirB2 family protein [Leeia]|uniref:SirB2 family protein n=1 Tax=Leeia aquatica TaxID=2725557 RepID=A0A847S6L0_9NEIS|nr:SirB2 family protein [Leeia aquatica]NLR74455.1 SirB2 family protein [Leeia aquatica]